MALELHRKEFELMLGDNFSEDELLTHERMLDAVAAVEATAVVPELAFDDFFCEPEVEQQQRLFFERCRSTLCLENMPFLETNPFQVSYLKLLLLRLGEVLIDQGGHQPLVFTEVYLEELAPFKTMDDLLVPVKKTPAPVRSMAPVDPIDFLIRDVSRELQRLHHADKMGLALQALAQQPSEKLAKLFGAFSLGEVDASVLLKKSGLNPKDFDDHLERLKFFLRKLV